MSLFTRNALWALAITLLIVGTVVYAVNYLNELRIEELNAIEEQISTDTLSLETQFALLEEAPCEDIQEGNILSDELGGLGDRLSFAEERLSADDPEVIRLKERYTLLQIRDYLLGKRLAQACDVESVVALYFYSNEGDCPDCDRAGYALSYLREMYPALRVYSFDYNLDMGALRTLIAVERIEAGKLPAFVIEGEQKYGFTDLKDLENAFPEAMFLSASSSASTTPEE